MHELMPVGEDARTFAFHAGIEEALETALNVHQLQGAGPSTRALDLSVRAADLSTIRTSTPRRFNAAAMVIPTGRAPATRTFSLICPAPLVTCRFLTPWQSVIQALHVPRCSAVGTYLMSKIVMMPTS